MTHKLATQSAYPANPFKKQSPYRRSRITRKVSAILEGDGRGALPRRYRDICANIAADQGGPEHCSEIKLSLIRRYAGLVVLGEKLDTDLINGREVNLGEMALVASTLSRLATRIGVRREAKNITPPDPREYLESKYGNGAAQRVIRARTIEHDDGDDAEDDDA